MRQIKICLGSSCYSRGNNVHLEVIKKYIAENHLEAEISFSGHLCEELCSSGPTPPNRRESLQRGQSLGFIQNTSGRISDKIITGERQPHP